MDPLTQLVELLQPRALLWKRLVGEGDWTWRMPADDGVVFGRVVDGRCRFRLPGAEEQGMGPGDYVLLTAPPSWTIIGGNGDGPVIDFDALPEDVISVGTAPESEHGHGAVRIVGGHFEFAPINAKLLPDFLAPVIHIPSGDRCHADQLTSIFAMMDTEAATVRPGQDAVLSRLLEIMLIELLRAPEMPTAQRRGMLTGLADQQIGAALRAFHADIRKSWSVAILAAVACMSRSVFSQRFTSLVGQPPMTYVLQWRMAVARDELWSGKKSVDEVARLTGYGSASAFSTAFTRTNRCPPAQFARRMQSA